ncbi:MAG: cytochrome b/b6 domain-containing protein [Ottowia sp.]|uniref:cytochrome b/b6 domain-containing protein n=1 Tax=Ottowia sp. TaxID=1898956 RepID=UPI003C72E6E1
MKSIRIWDLPTRLFHWLLALAVIGLLITGNVGGDAMNWHFRLGYTVFGLLAFRLIWGLIGGRWSRFTSFFPTPARLVRYLRGQATPEDLAGHNPLGAFSVLAMLLVLAAQVASGLVSDDEIAFAGPLTSLVSGSTVGFASGYHKDIGQWLIIALIVLHVLAILFYWLAKKNNLLKSMLGGDKTLPATVEPAHDTFGTRVKALVAIAVAAGIVYWVIQLGNTTF